MYDEISHHLFSGPGCRGCLEALEVFVTMYIEVATALVFLVLIALILLSISEIKRSKPGKTIADRSRTQRSERISLPATSYEHISLSQSSIS